jgi:hypothetical protein
MLRPNKAVLGPNRGQKGEPAFYLLKLLSFTPPKKKEAKTGNRQQAMGNRQWAIGNRQ